MRLSPIGRFGIRAAISRINGKITGNCTLDGIAFQGKAYLAQTNQSFARRDSIHFLPTG
jgi:hypothetical protein